VVAIKLCGARTRTLNFGLETYGKELPVVKNLELWQLVLALREEAKGRAVAKKKCKPTYKQPNPGQSYNLVLDLPVYVSRGAVMDLTGSLIFRLQRAFF
jgi:hypothetical protein